MRKATKYRNLICFAVVLIVLISITVAPSYAAGLTPQRMKAGIAAAITAINIAMNSALMPIQEMIDYVGDPYDYTYSYSEAWNDRPQIQIWDDYIEIDGVQYTDIFISNEAAEKFRVNAFDFQSAYNIASNSNGTFAEGTGTIYGLPVYKDGTTYFTQKGNILGVGTSTFGDQDFTVTKSSRIYSTYNYDWSQGAIFRVTDDHFPYTLQYKSNNSPNSWFLYNNNTAGTFTYNRGTGDYVSSPFDFDWVAGTIPVNTPLPEDTGMMIRIPSYDPLGNKYLEPFLIDNPEFDQGEPVTIDVTLDPDIMTKLDDLFDIIAPIIPVINNNYGDINFIENHEAPIPPVPDVPIVDATVPQVVQPIINEIQNQGDIISQSIPPIIESIPKIDEICNNIDTAPYHDLDTGLDKLPSVFLPFITDLRSALGIWHYVTEWIGMIGTSFGFITGCLAGTAIMTPIYAAIAGYMCIKVYRRMTG